VHLVFDPFLEVAHRAVLKAQMKTAKSKSQSATVPSLIRVIGCGNPAVADDGVGVAIVERLRRELPEEKRRDFSIVPSAGPELLYLLDSDASILFVDAVAGGAPPGTLHLIPLPSHGIETRPVSSLSSHGWGLLETLELAQRLKPHLPPMLLLGVELQSIAPLAAPTAAAERAMQRVIAGFPHLLEMLHDPASKLWREPQRFLPEEPLPWEEPCA
jgi:hydrogenase maturation protease